MQEERRRYVKTFWYPLYSDVRNLIQIWDGIPKASVIGMNKAIAEQTGTPQNPVGWSNPDDWIPNILSGEYQELALRIWVDSNNTVNPRYANEPYVLIKNYELLSVDSQGMYFIGDYGKKFLDEDREFVHQIDTIEGLPKVLAILASHSPARSGDLLDEWGEFLLEYSKIKKATTIRETLRRRILNLVERGYIQREGNTYTISEKGIAYADDIVKSAGQEPHQELIKAAKKYNDEQIRELRDRLGKMHPYDFEKLIKNLLEAMDYEDVVVTKQSGDKGIDVIANFQFGITQIKEVVQVKRQQGSITRPVLDQLRGVLPLHQAIRGTLITLGKFTSSCSEIAVFQGAAPITLIDGDMLIKLLLEHGIGVKKRTLSLVEVDETFFDQEDSQASLEAE